MTRLITIVLAASLATLPGCRGGDSNDAPDRRTLIDSRDTDDPRSLDPAHSTDVPTGRAVAYVFDGLVRFTPDARVEPALAERWEVSPNGLTYTFHLRRGVTFHDGTPFTARNVVRSFERVLSQGERPWPLLPIRGARAFQANEARSISGLSAPNDSTVVITLAEPLAVFITLLAMPVASIVPDSIPPDFGERPVGTGPWRFVEWRHDDYLRFARNASYFDGAPKAESLMARIIPEASTSVAEFESRTVDVLFVPEGETQRWRADEGRNRMLQSAAGLRLIYVGINTRRGVLSDVRVRQAINHAVDVRATLEELMGGRGHRAAGVIPPSLAGADTTRVPYAYDPARAAALLKEASYPEGTELELWHSQDATISRLAQTIQGYLAAAGIRVKLVQRDSPSVREAARNGQTDLVLKDWWADYPDAENFLYPLLHSANVGAGGNVSFFAHPEYDRLVTAARRELNETTRLRLYRQADSIAFAEAPMLYLFFSTDLFAVQPWVQGFEVPVMFNAQRWTNVSIGGEGNGGPPSAERAGGDSAARPAPARDTLPPRPDSSRPPTR
jgi:peptide/nickel transport system substrate-binding protein/oligopeptide transport system substrate-binding protein